MIRHKRFVFIFLSSTLALGMGLTVFYLLHEHLPRVLRAPSALILAPVAIVDGICYATGVRGIYGNLFAILVVNCLFSAMLCGLGYLGKSWWRRYTH